MAGNRRGCAKRPGPPCAHSSGPSPKAKASSTTVYEFKDAGSGNVSSIVWDDSATPDDNIKTTLETVTVKDGSFKNPACVDIRTGNVYRIDCSRKGKDWSFQVPVYDSPILVIDRKKLKLR